jgi:uncharacterized protein YggT (Ycf19 family)
MTSREKAFIPLGLVPIRNKKVNGPGVLFQIAASLLKGAVLFLYVYSWLIVIQSALLVFTRPKDKESKALLLLRRAAEPVNGPFRRLLHRTEASKMPVDISPMLSLAALWVLSQLLNQLAEKLSAFPF